MVVVTLSRGSPTSITQARNQQCVKKCVVIRELWIKWYDQHLPAYIWVRNNEDLLVEPEDGEMALQKDKI